MTNKCTHHAYAHSCSLCVHYYPLPPHSCSPTDPPENTTLSTGSVDVELGAQPPRVSCASKAYPEPSYEWRRHGRVIAKGNVLYIFRNMTVDDAGAYDCVAFNKHGNSSAAVHVNVLCRCSVSENKPHRKQPSAPSRCTMLVEPSWVGSDFEIEFHLCCLRFVLYVASSLRCRCVRAPNRSAQLYDSSQGN